MQKEKEKKVPIVPPFRDMAGAMHSVRGLGLLLPQIICRNRLEWCVVYVI